MRWERAEPGDERIRTLFLWLPMRVGREERWLEKVKVREVLTHLWGEVWQPVEFLDL